MKEAFGWVIRTCGQEMICRDKDGVEQGRGMAIVQPMTEADRQDTAWALGSSVTHRFLCLAQPGLPLDRLGYGGTVGWGGADYEILTARPVWVGDRITHLWAALCPAREVAP